MNLNANTQLGILIPRNRDIVLNIHYESSLLQRGSNVINLYNLPINKNWADESFVSGWSKEIEELKKGATYYYLSKSIFALSSYININNIQYDKIISLGNKHLNLLIDKDSFYQLIKVDYLLQIYYFNININKSYIVHMDLKTGNVMYTNGFKEEIYKLLKLITFLEFGDITTQILKKGKSNGKSLLKGKIKNSSPTNITIVDSKWNHILIKSDQFGVRGHFRLQPYGKKNQKIKLIWIDSFIKSGYTRKGGGVKLQEQR